MCNCQDTEGFDQSLSKAKFLTESTGEVHVAYVHKAVNQSFVRKESDLSDELGICCYFLADGTEVKYKRKSKSMERVPANKVIDSSEVAPEAKPSGSKPARRNA